MEINPYNHHTDPTVTDILFGGAGVSLGPPECSTVLQSCAPALEAQSQTRLGPRLLCPRHLGCFYMCP